ncbi:hypothetical protein KSF_063300 [Reticulibacter mediterranei]|uniref:Uncharacterized protein n=1 Tax=Reticulibacter mediterranei TaxID=2778369 RepID=A0A8J3IT17_9CHLR|nr:hypothetical protein [Reticulibacter mediterranei]GHO96282.1 hypothetical protein KSF_063300 [Reticulibacter mediterranei]
MSNRTTRTAGDEQRIVALFHLYTFCEIVHNHLMIIEEMEATLNESSIPFRGRGTIRPVQCNRAVNTLQEVQLKLHSFCQLFHSDITSLPIAFTILSFRFLPLINEANEQTILLIHLIEDFRSDCMTPSSAVLQQRKSIFVAFGRLLSHLYSIPLQFMDIKTEARQITVKLVLQHQQST